MNHPGGMDARAISSVTAQVDRQLAGVNAPIRKVVLGVLEDLAPLLSEMFANVDDYFFSRAERADDSDHHHVYFDAMRKIRSGRAQITAKFVVGIIDAAAEFWVGRRTAKIGADPRRRPHFDAGTMSVLNEEEMELSVAVSGIVQRGRSRYATELASLIETLKTLARETPDDGSEHHPLATRSIVQSFARAIQGLSLELQVMLSFLKLFERHVADHLGRAYSGALSRLEGDGIRIVAGRVRRSSPIERAQPAPAALPGVGSERGSGGAGQAGTVAFSELQALLNAGLSRDLGGPGGPGGPGGAGGSGRPGVPVDQLIDSVSSVQHRYVDHLGPIGGFRHNYPSLQSFLLSLPVEKGGFRDAGRDQQDILKLVSGLFEHIFRNENLSVASEALIARMQFPVLKVALLDQSLFSDSDHPVRQLLNRIAIDGIGWPPSEALLKRNPLYLAAEDIVARLNDRPKPDVELFAHLLQEWTEVASSYKRRAKTAVRRLNETALGKAKLDAAKGIVQTTVNGLAEGARLPGIVTSFISGAWTQAMVVACVKNGTVGDSWRELCSTLEDLLRVFEPVDSGGVRGTPESGALVERMRGCLERYGVTAAAAHDALSPIAELLEQISCAEDDGGLSTAGYEVEDLEIMEEICLTDAIDPEEAPSPDDYRLEQLALGGWVEIEADDLERPLRCQLALVVEETQMYIFSDDKGVKVRELSRRSLLEGLVAGRIRIIREELLVERAIEELMASLRSYSPEPVLDGKQVR